MAVDLVLFAAERACLVVVVAARLAVVAVRVEERLAEVAVPFTPDFAALAVLAAPRLADRAVRRVPVATDEPVSCARLTVRSPLFLAVRIASMAESVRSAEAERTRLAVARATFDPVGETRGFLRPRTVATRSPSAVTYPWASPLTASPIRSATPAAAPTRRFCGGVPGERG